MFQNLLAKFFGRFAPGNDSPVLLLVAVAVILILIAAVLAPLLFTD